jgi:hypothetical protein
MSSIFFERNYELTSLGAFLMGFDFLVEMCTISTVLTKNKAIVKFLEK